MARAKALSMIDDSPGSLISEFPSDGNNFCRRSLSGLSFRSAPIDYNLRSSISMRGPSESSISIHLSPSFSGAPPSALEPLPLFEQPFNDDEDKEPPQTSCGRLAAKQNEIAAIRSLARERRAELRHKRNEVNDLEVAFMKKLNQLFVDLKEKPTQPDPSLLAAFDKYQDAKNDYSSLEDDYNQLETQLDRQEFELEEAGKNLEISNDEPEMNSSLNADNEEAPKYSSAAETYHPLVVKYLTRTGDVSLLKEELWNLRTEFDMARDDQNVKNRFGLSVHDSEALDLLENFPQYEREILDDLAAAENDVEDLKAQCDEQHLLEPPKTTPEPISNPLASLNEVPSFQWSNRSPSFFEESLARQAFMKDKISMRAFINKWLLHQLFQSSLDRLRSSPELRNFPSCEPVRPECGKLAKLELTDLSPNSSTRLYIPAPADHPEKVMSTPSPDVFDSTPHTPKNDGGDKPIAGGTSNPSPFQPQVSANESPKSNHNDDGLEVVLDAEAHLNAIDLIQGGHSPAFEPS